MLGMMKESYIRAINATEGNLYWTGVYESQWGLPTLVPCVFLYYLPVSRSGRVLGPNGVFSVHRFTKLFPDKPEES